MFNTPPAAFGMELHLLKEYLIKFCQLSNRISYPYKTFD